MEFGKPQAYLETMRPYENYQWCGELCSEAAKISLDGFLPQIPRRDTEMNIKESPASEDGGR
jgi:hypothetical protein